MQILNCQTINFKISRLTITLFLSTKQICPLEWVFKSFQGKGQINIELKLFWAETGVWLCDSFNPIYNTFTAKNVILVCKRNDPNLNQCIINAGNHISKYLATGIFVT